jgi:hypothetical protein
MTDQERLELIAKELRQFASTASGIPSMAGVSPITLLDYANQLVRIAGRMDDVRGRTVEEVVEWIKKHSNVHGIAIAIFQHAVRQMDQEEDGA